MSTENQNMPQLPPEIPGNQNMPPLPPGNAGNQNMPPLPPEIAENKVKKCPKCGSQLVFDPQSKALKCVNCGNIEDAGISQTAGEENDLMDLLNNVQLNEADEEIDIKCPSCGAPGKLAKNTVSGFCEYCKAPIVAASSSQRTLRPQAAVPFAIQRNQAEAKFKDWVKGLWFAPNALKYANLSETMKGVYRPIWTFDFRTTTNYTGERGEHYYVTKTVKGSDGKTREVQERKTRWYPASGTVRNTFDDIVVFASRKMNTQLQNAVGPWEIKNPAQYSEDTVRGFVEESYDLPLANGLSIAKEKAQDRIHDSICEDIGGDEQRVHQKHTKYFDLTYKLLLVPFWSSIYRFGGKEYQFLVNGENGRCNGDRPYSAIKITLLILAIIAIFAILLYYNTHK